MKKTNNIKNKQANKRKVRKPGEKRKERNTKNK